jgi:hypothetical protein
VTIKYLLVLFAALSFSACSRNENAPKPTDWPPTYGLSPITDELKNEIIGVMTQTDSLDTLINQGCTVEEYANKAASIMDSTTNFESTLPPNDPRTVLFGAVIAGYSKLGLDLETHEPQNEMASTYSITLSSKRLLLKILFGTLDKKDEQMLNKIKQRIKLD